MLAPPSVLQAQALQRLCHSVSGHVKRENGATVRKLEVACFNLGSWLYARYNFVENIWITNTGLRHMEKSCLCFMLGSINLHINSCRRFTLKLMQLCGWNNLLVIRILSRIGIEGSKNGTWLVPENSQSIPYVLISNDSHWNPPCLKGTAYRYCHCMGQTQTILFAHHRIIPSFPSHTLFPKSLGS